MEEESRAAPPAGLLRRLGALLYDTLLSAAIAFVATLLLLPLSGGEAILVSTRGFAGHAYHACLLALVFGYFGLGWTRGGQTLGMKAWRIRLVAADGQRVTWADAAVRFTIGVTFALLALVGAWQLAKPRWSVADAVALFLFAPALFNLAWIRIDRSARSFQDLAGDVRVIRAR